MSETSKTKGIVSKKLKETHKSKRSTISGSSSSSSEDSSTSSTSKATTSSKSRAKTKLAVLEARLNAQKEIDKLNEKHARERLDFEEELIRQKHVQAEAVALAEKQQFELQRLREEKELPYQQKLTQAHLEAQLKEAIAELTAHQSSSTASNAERSQRLIANTDTPYSMTSCENSSPQQTVSTILQSDNTPHTFAATATTNLCAATNLSATRSSAYTPNFTNAPYATVHTTSDTNISNPSVVNCFTQCRPNDNHVGNMSFPSSRAVFPNDAFNSNNADSNNSPFLSFRGAGANSTASPLANASLRVTFGVPGLGHISEGLGSVFVGQQLPTFEVKPPVFDGNSEAYYNFTDAFDSLIDAQIKDPKLKLYYLLQYTKGVAHTLIQGCQYMPPDVGYLTAKRLLRDHFGQKLQVATACVNTVTNGPVLSKKDVSAILEFSAKLTACQYTLAGMNYLHKMDNVDIIRKITRRFPPQWLSSWEHLVDQILHVQQRDINFSDLSSFVATKTRECTNFVTQPVNYCSDSSLNAASAGQKQQNKRVAKSFGIQAKTGTQPAKQCQLCNGPHYLNQCQQFRKMTYDERRTFVEKESLCICCLNKRHFSSKCERKTPCRYDGCKKRHTTLLHPPSKDFGNCTEQTDKDKTLRNPSDPKSQSKNSKQTVDCINGLVSATAPSSGMLPVIPVKVRLQGTKTLVQTKAFFDNGSTNSFITSDLMNKLGIRSCTEIIVNTATLNCNTENYKRTKVVNNVLLLDFAEINSIQLAPLLSTDNLPISASDVVTQDDLKDFPEFSDIFVPHVECEVGLLIGNDNLRAFQPLEVVTTSEGSYAIKTVAGWIAYCANWKKPNEKAKSFFSKSCSMDLCSLCYDVMDSTINPKKELSVEQARFLDSVSSSIQHLSNDHYEIDLPIRNENLRMPQNKELAVQRAMYLKRRFKRDARFQQHYQDFMKDLIEKGYAEEVPDKEVQDGKVWYLPHHGVYHPEKLNKIRVVFDASAKFQGISLNQALLPGPDLTNNLISVLLRFRREKIALQGDIQAMFHQVSVPVKDRDLFRFVWWKDGKIDGNLMDY